MTSLSKHTQNKRRALVVDDDAVTLAYVTGLLQVWGYFTIAARDGSQALDLAESFRPHVVILDINMPVVTGWEVLRKLRRMPATEAAFFLVLTGMAHAGDSQVTQAAGGHAHLTKPFALEEMKALLDQEQNICRRHPELKIVFPEELAVLQAEL